MPSRRRTQLSFGELMIRLVGIGFMMLVMFSFLPGGGGARVAQGLMQLAVLSVISVIVLAVLFLIVRHFLAKSRQSTDAIATTPVAAYERQPVLLTPAERSFFGVLQQSVASDYIIFSKVRLADIVRPSNSSHSAWQAAFNRITGKHVDFVICEPGRVNVVAAIELDDRSHETLEAGFRDNLVDSALTDAGIRF
jgi:hypothetical protein